MKVGDIITYEINYRNYEDEAATVTIKDKLDDNVQFVEASDGGTCEGAKTLPVNGEDGGGTVTWTLTNVEAGAEGVVTLKVKVLKGALKSNGGNGNVINDGDTATVQVGNDSEYKLNTVENPLPEKKEVSPYEGTGILGPVKVGDEITYEISYRNYKKEAADVVIKDMLDPNVAFVSASDDGSHSGEKAGGIVTWTFKAVPAGKEGKVTLTVKVLEGAMKSKGGEGKVVNGGPGATVKVGNDNEFELNEVENPVPEEPEKKEITPYEGKGILGTVQVGDEITYEITYMNYKSEAVDIIIKDKLDPNVEFVSASDSGVLANGVVTWTLKAVPAGKSGKVTLTVKVLEGALTTAGGPGEVVNGGDSATVKVGNDSEYKLNEVRNPVEKNRRIPGLVNHVGDCFE